MVHLVKNKEGIVVGWELRPTTPEEQELAGRIRNLEFFGFEDTAVDYCGLELIDDNKGKEIGNIKSLKWIQKGQVHNI